VKLPFFLSFLAQLKISAYLYAENVNDMDDGFFGFLVFLGIMIAGTVYRKRQEAKEEEAANPTQQAAPSLKDIFKEMTKPQVQKPSKKKSHKPDNRPTTDFIGRNNYQKEELRAPEVEQNVRSPYAFNSLDEVKKAFIWSEILRRKY